MRLTNAFIAGSQPTATHISTPLNGTRRTQTSDEKTAATRLIAACYRARLVFAALVRKGVPRLVDGSTQSAQILLFQVLLVNERRAHEWHVDDDENDHV